MAESVHKPLGGAEEGSLEMEMDTRKQPWEEERSTKMGWKYIRFSFQTFSERGIGGKKEFKNEDGQN